MSEEFCKLPPELSNAYFFIKIPEETKELGLCKDCKFFCQYDETKDYCKKYNQFTDYDRHCKSFEKKK